MLKNLQKIKKVLMVLLVTGVIVYSAIASSTGTEISAITPDKALQNLKEGNERFVSGKSSHPRIDSARLLETSKNGQHPFATVLTCSDSRLPAELIFDQGIGDVFVVRVAGNVCDTDEAGTIEYGVGHLGTPLLVVMGHTGCGAVTAVATEAKLGGNIAPLVDNIKPAVAKAAALNPHLNKQELVPEAIKANCWQSIEDLLKVSTEARELVKTGKLKIVAAIYNIETGKVGWLGTHPDQSKLLASFESSEKKETAAAETGKGKENVAGQADEPKKDEPKKDESNKSAHTDSSKDDKSESRH